ncbi:hypothetical protein R1sor_009752 [Riccia sorocarpa]|uniref:Uncharacterized protein n=1 Tax=Riccia sorocarpa TaxID=122646 RepID=A0ABD3HXS8_9MARC
MFRVMFQLSSGDTDCGSDLLEESDSDHDDEIDDLAALLEAMERSKYLTRKERMMTALDFYMGHEIA